MHSNFLRAGLAESASILGAPVWPCAPFTRAVAAPAPASPVSGAKLSDYDPKN